MGKNSQPKRRSSGFNEHKQVGKRLIPPLAQLPVKPAHWSIDVLPDMLLVDAVAAQFPWKNAPKILHSIFDILDRFVSADSKEILLGTISTLALIPQEHRADALAALKNADLLSIFLPEALCHGLALYPGCPVAWLIADWKKDRTVDWEQGVSYLQEAVSRLWNSKDVYSTRCRMFSVARMLKHGKLLFFSDADLEVTDLLPRYPQDLSEEDQRAVEAWSRATFNALFNAAQDHRVPDWIPYFWRHNYEISSCQPISNAAKSSVTADTFARAKTAVDKVATLLQRATQQAKLDLYSVDRDEVLFGLLGRQYRLFRALATNTTFWAADLGVMFHRVMADLLITFKWLLQQNDVSYFSSFKHFSLGKQKLLHLHAQDLADQGREELGQFAEDLLDEINEEVWEALVSIDLGGNFAGIDMRKMAHEVDLREIYNLVYSPASAELHGEWASLKRYNLVRCGNPLHRFHRLPQFASSPYIFPQAVLRAGKIFIDTFLLWLEAYHLSGFSEEGVRLLSEMEAIFF